MKQIFTFLLLCTLATGAFAQTYNVTFKVNMNEVAAAFTTPEVNGTFNGWCGGCNPMSDADADGIWETTIALESGTYEFKYANDAWAGQENLIEGSPCTITAFGFTNRTLVVAGADVVFDPVCWGACDDCAGGIDGQMDLPVTFDMAGVAYGVIGFGGAEASTIEVDPTDATNMVVKVIKSATAELWAGTTVTDALGSGFASAIPVAPGATTMTVRVWSPDAGIQVRLKIEDYNDPTKSVETEATTTVAGDWETLTFDFANEAPGTAVINYGYYYNKASIFFNFGVTGAVAGEKTYYFDDVQFGAGGGIADQMDLPVTFEDADIAYGLIGFGGAEASTIETDPTDATNTVAKVIKSATAELWAGTTVTDGAGSGFASAIPFAPGATTMTVRVWSPDAGIQVRLKTEDYADPTKSVETEATTTVAGDWETLTFDFSNEAPGTAAINYGYYYNKASIFFNFGVTGADAGEKTYYFDDVQFGAGGPVSYNVTFKVNMNDVVDPFTTPEVNGTFNGWCGGCNPLSDIDGDGIWETTLSIPEGVIEYKFAYDAWAGSENLIEGDECTITTDGFTNRFLDITNDIVLDEVCWGSCLSCDGLVTYDVTFSVNMNEVAAGFTTPEVNGTFNGWCGGCNPLSDIDGDGVWTATIALAPGTYQYKFAYDAWAGSETLADGAACTINDGGFVNRIVDISADTDLGTVCWGSCLDCGAAVTYDVKFTVDMNDAAEAFTTPEVNGTFNGWCGGCAPMSDLDGDNIWELTIPLEAGIYEYKFAYDTWAGQENLIEGDPCTITAFGFTNRTLEVSADADLDTVCWGSCSSCEATVPAHDIVFQVDMSTVTDAYTTPEVNGTFNGWCGGCAPMSDLDGDNIWEITITLPEGNYEYKFAYDAWAGQENLTEGDPCTITTDAFTNRALTVSDPATLDAVCWGLCVGCQVGINDHIIGEVSVWPQPTTGNAYLTFEDATFIGANAIITDITGRLLQQSTIVANNHEFNLNGYAKGLYQIIVVNNGQIIYSNSLSVQ